MGYYSLYRIIKDIIHTLFRRKFSNKILLIIILIIFVILIFSSTVFSASSVNVDYNDETYTFNFSDACDYKYKIIFVFYNEHVRYDMYHIIMSDSPLVCYQNRSEQYGYKCADGSLCYYTDNRKLSSNNSISSSVVVESSGISYSSSYSPSLITYANFDIEDVDGNIVYNSDEGPSFENPHFITTKEELSSGKFDTLKIDAGDFDTLEDEFGLAIFDITSYSIDILGNKLPSKATKTFILNAKSNYLVSNNLDLQYYIPQESLGITFENGKKYLFCLANPETGELYSSISFEVGGLTTEEEIKNKEDEQTDAIKENTETNKRNLGNN